MLRSRRFAFAAAAVLLGLSACGDAASTTTAGKEPAVIHIGAGANSAKLAAGSAPAADRMMAMQDVTYVFDGSFPELGATAPAWVLPAGGVVDQARITKLAELLGVKGEVRALPADQGGGFMVGAEDYSTANLTVAADGMLSWWFNPAPMSPNVGVECVSAGSTGSGAAGTDVAVAPDTVAPGTVAPDTIAPDALPPDTVSPACATPTPPANVPTKDAALAQATALLTSMGYDVSQFQFDTYADEWGANVQGYRLLDGHRSPLTVSVGYGAEGALTWASGALAEPQPAADYPLVSGDVALQRLNDRTGRWGWFGAPGIMAAGAMAKGGGVTLDAASTAVAPEPIAAPEPATTDTAVLDTAVVDSTAITPTPIEPPMPVDSIQLEPITIHLTAMRMDLTMVWADDGTIWLLPAYTFTAADGGEFTIVAVDESFLDTPDPATPDTTPVDSAPVDTVVVPETVPAETLPVDTVPATPTS